MLGSKTTLNCPPCLGADADEVLSPDPLFRPVGALLLALPPALPQALSLHFQGFALFAVHDSQEKAAVCGMHNVTKRPTRPQGPSGTPGAPGPSGPFRIPVLPGLVAVSVLVVIASLVSLISFTTHAERTPAVKPDAAAHAPVRARAADSPTAAAAAATAAAPATAAEGAPSATSADAPDAASPASQAGAAVQHGERANELYGSREVRWSRSTPFALVFWDERAQDINLGSTRNFIKWLNENFGQTVNASLVRCHAGSDCDARLAPADGIGIVGSIADRNKAELGSNRMGYVRTHALLKSKLLFLSMTGDEYCQLKSHQNVDLVFRNYWDAPYMGAYGAHLPGGHAAWMPMGKGHAMPEVEPLELQGKPGPSRKYLFNLVVCLRALMTGLGLCDLRRSGGAAPCVLKECFVCLQFTQKLPKVTISKRCPFFG